MSILKTVKFENTNLCFDKMKIYCFSLIFVIIPPNWSNCLTVIVFIQFSKLSNRKVQNYCNIILLCFWYRPLICTSNIREPVLASCTFHHTFFFQGRIAHDHNRHWHRWCILHYRQNWYRYSNNVFFNFSGFNRDISRPLELLSSSSSCCDLSCEMLLLLTWNFTSSHMIVIFHYTPSVTVTVSSEHDAYCEFK